MSVIFNFVRNLQKMAQFASNFTVEEIMSQAATQIPWFTIVIIMGKSKSHEEMLWYINQTHKFGWSRSQVISKFIEDLTLYLTKRLKSNNR